MWPGRTSTSSSIAYPWCNWLRPLKKKKKKKTAWQDTITSLGLWSALSHPHDEVQIFSGPDFNYDAPHLRRLWELTLAKSSSPPLSRSFCCA